MPALLVSPYARRGYVDSTPLDTTSIPGLHRAQLAARARRTRAARLGRAFDFSAASARGAHRLRRARVRRAPGGPHLGDLPRLRGGSRRCAVALIGWVGLRRTLLATSLLMALAAPAARDRPRTRSRPCRRCRGCASRSTESSSAPTPPDGRHRASRRRGSPRRAHDRDQARRARPLRPLVRRPPDRRDQPRVPRRASASSTSTASASTRRR